jgi:hypothetical protein
MGDCFTADAASQFAAKDTNRLVGSITKVLARRSPFIDVLDGGTFPNGVSDVVRSVVQERAVMAVSLAKPEFTNDTEMCGTSGEQDQVGSTEYQYRLGTLRGRGPRICVKQSRSSFKGTYLNAQQSMEKGVLQIVNADIRATLLFRSGVKFVANSGGTFNQLLTGDSQLIDTPFAGYLPDSAMNFKALYKLGTFLREEMLAEPFMMKEGEYFKVLAGADQIEAFRNDADVKEDLRALTTGSYRVGEKALTGYSWEGYRGFAFGIDPQPARFNAFDGDGFPVLIEPEIGVAATNGVAARRNPDWVNAKYEIGHVIGGNSFKRRVPESYVGEGTFKFAPQLAAGQLKWHYVIDNDCNMHGDFGWHIYEISRAYEPIRPHTVIPFAYERCETALGLSACPPSGDSGL